MLHDIIILWHSTGLRNICKPWISGLVSREGWISIISTLTTTNRQQNWSWELRWWDPVMQSWRRFISNLKTGYQLKTNTFLKQAVVDWIDDYIAQTKDPGSLIDWIAGLWAFFKHTQSTKIPNISGFICCLCTPFTRMGLYAWIEWIVFVQGIADDIAQTLHLCHHWSTINWYDIEWTKH